MTKDEKIKIAINRYFDQTRGLTDDEIKKYNRDFKCGKHTQDLFPFN